MDCGNRVLHFQAKWYQEYTWLHFNQSAGKVFCFSCCRALKLGLFPPSLKTEPAFIDQGFNNWKKAHERFNSHQKSQQHLTAAVKLSESKSSNIATSLTEASKKALCENRLVLRAIFTSLQYLAKQGLPIQGADDSKGNFKELLALRCEDIPALRSWSNRSITYTSHDIQNEILEMMAHEIVRNLLLKVRASKFFSLIADETTDISTKEQLSFTLRYVDEHLKSDEIFLGLYEMRSTTGEAITDAIIDILRRFDLDITFCRGQCYDGASNMKGQYLGVQSRIKSLEPRATYVHCFNHSLNLALQDAVRGIGLMRDTLQYVNDAAVIIGRSAKR